MTNETIEPWLREILRCPRCKGVLTDAQGPSGPELLCPSCRLAYPVEDGVPVLLVDLARPTSD
ncbi:Trm112 family protein [Intrasporangium sp. DVR]|uniref:Trm112 family protein n=1 Tax=Intrasporangium sp. DVR TaxID=3127867 RepID=UPI00313A6D92